MSNHINYRRPESFVRREKEQAHRGLFSKYRGVSPIIKKSSTVNSKRKAERHYICVKCGRLLGPEGQQFPTGRIGNLAYQVSNYECGVKVYRVQIKYPYVVFHFSEGHKVMRRSKFKGKTKAIRAIESGKHLEHLR